MSNGLLIGFDILTQIRVDGFAQKANQEGFEAEPVQVADEFRLHVLFPEGDTTALIASIVPVPATMSAGPGRRQGLTAVRAEYRASQWEVRIGLLVGPGDGAVGLCEQPLYFPEQISIDERLEITSDSFAKRINVPDVRFALKHGAKRMRAGSLSGTQQKTLSHKLISRLVRRHARLNKSPRLADQSVGRGRVWDKARSTLGAGDIANGGGPHKPPRSDGCHHAGLSTLCTHFVVQLRDSRKYSLSESA